MKIAIAYAASAVTFLLMDAVWLGFIAKPWYQSGLGHLMAAKVNLTAALAFYALYILGLWFFAIKAAWLGGDWRTAAFLGAAYGFFAYATYDLTNLATLRDVSVKIALIDLAWGTFVSAIAATAGFWASQSFAVNS